MAEYAERDIMALDRQGNYYAKHVHAMTAEGLHSKSDIAAELAWRDAQIEALERKLEAEDISHSNTIDQRDHAENMADQLSAAIMGITGRDIGEHSSANCPWSNALEHAEEYGYERDADVIAALRFPTMLRKMWSGGEVQRWLDEQAEEKRRQSQGANNEVEG